MEGSTRVSRSQLAWRLSKEQHGLIARRQLRELGFSVREVERRIAGGRLLPVTRGVYSVGWAPETRIRRWTAALLACGTDAVLSPAARRRYGGLPRRARKST